MEVAHRPPTDLQEFMEKDAEFINGEVTIRALTAARGTAVEAPKKETPKVSASPKKVPFSKKDEKGKPITQRELNLTPLNTNLIELLHEVNAISEAR